MSDSPTKPALPTRPRRAASAPPAPAPPPPPAGAGGAPRQWSISRLRGVAVPAALGLALFAEHLAADARGTDSGAPPLLSWLLFGLAAILFVLGTRPAPPITPVEPPPAADGPGRFQPRGFFILLGLAGLSAVLAAPLFAVINATPGDAVPPEPANTGAWLCWLAALVLFGLAWIVRARTRPAIAAPPAADPPGDRLPAQIEWAILVGLLGLALLLRLPGLEQAPPGLWTDEAQNGIVARQLLAPGAAHPTFISGITQLGAFYFYLLGSVIALFGGTIAPLRLLPALAGAALVPLLYLLAARLYGWRAGLVAGGLLAVSAWNITFSRFGIASIPTVALDLGVYLCLVQALRTGRLGYYAAGGVLLGLALQMYYVASLVPLILLIVLLHVVLTLGPRTLRAVRGGLAVFALGAVLAFLPVGLFAVQRPAAYAARISAVSALNPAVNHGDPHVLTDSLTKHLLMFNFLGDGNGRHNLPGAPMLDDLTAALFFLGLGVCVLRARRWPYVFPLVWFGAALAGGVLSVPFEAPQSHRTLENSVVTALLAGIALGEGLGGLTLTRVRPLLRRPAGLALGVVGSLLAVAWAGSQNIPRYFVTQAGARDVWEYMNTGQAQAAQEVRQAAPAATVYLSPLYLDNPALRYLAPGVTPLLWSGLDALPVAAPGDRDVVIIMDERLVSDLSLIARLYPHTTFAPLQAPTGGGALLYTIHIPAADIQAVHGVRAALYDPGAKTAWEERSLPATEFDWGSGGTAPGTLRLAATLRVDQYGTYGFDWQPAGGAGAGLLVDGYPVPPGGLALGVGLHSIVATDTVPSASGLARLRWTPPGGTAQAIDPQRLFDPRRVEPHGLTGSYRVGEAPGPPGVVRVDPVIGFFYYRPALALDRPYTVVWSGRLYVPEAGAYQLGTEQITRSTLALDGNVVLANSQANNYQEVALQLAAGWHDLRLDFLDAETDSHIYLYWTPPGHPRSVIPAAFLWPQLGQYPTLPESGAWPTLAQADGMTVPANEPTGTPPAATLPPAAATPQPATPPPAAPTAAGTALEPRLLLGAAETALPEPRAAGADAAGNLYIYTGGDSRIYKFAPGGQLLTRWDVLGPDGKPLTEGSALLVRGSQVAVLDAATGALLTYDLDGQAGARIALCACFSPRGLAAAGDGNLWVTDTGYNQLRKVTPAGQTLQTLGAPGAGPGQFAEPASVWETPQGTLYVADISNARVQSLDLTGKPLAAWPVGASVARDGNRLAGDAAGNVLVAQAAGQAVVRYSPQGQELQRWIYQRNGQTLTPTGIAPVTDDTFLVLFLRDNLAAVFAFGP